MTNRIEQAFAEHARSTPDRVCLRFGDASWTYAEVDAAASRVARALEAAGVRQGDVAAIVAKRGPGLVWKMLGALRHGATFVVIDASYPLARRKQLLEIAAPAVTLLTEGVDAQSLTDAPVITAGTAAAVPLASPTPLTTEPADAAYYLMTSGTTGAPKCVAVGHAPLVNFLGWHRETFDLTENDVFTMLSGLSHDPLLRDVFTPLSIGATLCIPAQSEILEPGALRRWLARVGATVVHLTPQLGRLIAAVGPDAPALPRLRRFFWGGDQLPAATVEALREIAPAAEHVNFFGSTETPQAAAFFRVPDPTPEGRLPIGRGSRGFELLVVDEGRKPVEPGERGEIAIRSRFLALGYVENGRIGSFGAREGAAEDGERIYYTGDLGFVDPHGDTVLIGRADDQLKIRGFRVDLSEVAAALGTHPHVSTAIALAVGPEDGRRIEAFVVPKSGAAPEASALQSHMAASAPDYMAPARIHMLPEGLPLLPNGKTDRKALHDRVIAADAAFSRAPTPRAPDDPHAAAIVRRWSEIFPRARVDAASSFKSLGGDSLSYVEAYLAIEKIAGPPPADWPDLSIAQIAARRRTTPTRFAPIDSVIAFRAIALVLLVVQHVQITAVGDGLTEALLMISGFLLGQTHWDNMFARERLAKVLTPLKGIFPPLLFFTGLLVIYVLLKGDPLTFTTLFAQDFHVVNPGKIEYVLYWYVHCLVQLIALTFAVQYVGLRWLGAAARPLHWAIAVTAIFVALRFLPPLLASDLFGDGGVRREVFEHYPILYTSPHAHLASFWLGILAAVVLRTGRKLWLSVALVAYGAASALIYWPGMGVGLLICAGVLLYSPRLFVPRGVDRALLAVSAAAIFIYLGQMWFTYPVTLADKLMHLPPALVPALKLTAVLIGGVAAYHLFRSRAAIEPIGQRLRALLIAR